MTWISWGRHSCSSHCPQSPSKCGGRSSSQHPWLTLQDLQNKNNCSSPSSGTPGLFHAASPEPPGPLQQPTMTELSLASITVPLESIKPSSILPLTVYDQHGFQVLFHFAQDWLPGHLDVLVLVVSMLSTTPQPICNIVFQSAVPKVKVKLQPPSVTEVLAFNPIVHPSAITEVLLQPPEGEGFALLQASLHHGQPDLQQDVGCGPDPLTRDLGEPLEQRAGGERKGQQDWAPSSLGGRLWCPRIPFVPMARSPGPLPWRG
ncbi:ADP-ribosylation factor-binding protein GGA1-like [Mustela erminea]|uniref:ADP-ribosylation factor-binding protein GGA1-like n=1 Tax=Mustela erminea TaxID=36723 RepID=UPI0013874A0C|nr:ADP-ribosylation factor-binding protein GGA1-like [Mustela erminea]